jgi:hypothetical protein
MPMMRTTYGGTSQGDEAVAIAVLVATTSAASPSRVRSTRPKRTMAAIVSVVLVAGVGELVCGTRALRWTDLARDERSAHHGIIGSQSADARVERCWCVV